MLHQSHLRFVGANLFVLRFKKVSKVFSDIVKNNCQKVKRPKFFLKVMYCQQPGRGESSLGLINSEV